MNKPTAVHRDSLKPRYEYDFDTNENAPMLNTACPSCGKRRYAPLGPKDGYIAVLACDPCANMAVERAAAKRIAHAEKEKATARAKVERMMAMRARNAK